MQVETEDRKEDREELRFGVCRNCRTRFWWTGAISKVPDCSCGRRHTKEDFLKAPSSPISAKQAVPA